MNRLFFVISLFFLLLFSISAGAQSGSLEFMGSTLKNQMPLANAKVTLYRDSEKQITISTSRKGKFKLDLEYGSDYKITFSYPGCVDMHLLVLAKIPKAKYQLLTGYEIDVTFFDSTDQTIDLKKYENPLTKIVFDGQGAFTDDEKYLDAFTRDLFMSKVSAPEVASKISIAGTLLTGENSNPLVNTRINLVNKNGDVIQTAISNAHGAFVFSNLPPDESFIIKLEENDNQLPASTIVKMYNKNGRKIMDATTDVMGKFEFAFLPPDKISSSVMSSEDANLNSALKGSLTTLDHKPLSNSKINLMNDKGQILQSSTTDEMGKFIFKNLPPEQNYVVVLDRSDAQINTLNKLLLNDSQGKLIKELSMNPGDTKFKFQFLAPDKTAMSLMNIEDASIAINGKLSSGEGQSIIPFANSKINLMDSKGLVVQTTNTDSKGNFSFTNLHSDQNYTVALDESDVKLSSLSKLHLSDKEGKIIRELNVSDKQGFKFQVLIPDNNSMSLMSVEDPQINIKARLSSGEGQEEAPFAHSKINLIDSKGQIIQTTTTDNKGNFSFSHLPSDQNYKIALDETDQKFASLTKLHVSDMKGNLIKELVASDKDGFKFEVLAADNNNRSLMEVADAIIKMDIKSKIMQGDGSNKPLANSKIVLMNQGQIIQSTTTDGNGNFSFTNLPSDKNYSFVLDASDSQVIPSGKFIIANEKGQTIKELNADAGGTFKYEILPQDKKEFGPIYLVADEPTQKTENKMASSNGPALAHGPSSGDSEGNNIPEKFRFADLNNDGYIKPIEIRKVIQEFLVGSSTHTKSLICELIDYSLD